jgi:hypothetical protein
LLLWMQEILHCLILYSMMRNFGLIVFSAFCRSCYSCLWLHELRVHVSIGCYFQYGCYCPG